MDLGYKLPSLQLWARDAGFIKHCRHANLSNVIAAPLSHSRRAGSFDALISFAIDRYEICRHSSHASLKEKRICFGTSAVGAEPH